MAVKKGSLVVGHIPRKISAVCSLFLRTGTITATVRDSRQYSSDLLQGGLEVPCMLRLCGEVKNIDKVRKLLPANREQDNDKPPPLKKVKLSEIESVIVNDGISLNTSAAESNLETWIALDDAKLTLTEEDKRRIVEGDELTDKHINFAQALIKKQFKNINGLSLTFLFSAYRGAMFSTGHPTLQIVHTRGSHWIVATTNELCTKVFVYDTLYSDVTHDTKRLITEMFGMSQIEVVHGLQKQKGMKDWCVCHSHLYCTGISLHRFTFRFNIQPI